MRTTLGFLLILALAWTVPARATVTVRDAFPNLSFLVPVDIQEPGDGTNRLFIVELGGLIWVVDNDSTTTQRTLFLNISGPVGGGEGLLGLAFHPNYATNGFFFVNYTADTPNRSVIARCQVSTTDPDVAVAESLQVILEIPQPFPNHNGGAIAFGPSDGYLYIPMGDGGSQNDPMGNGQNPTNLLGTVMRIDVDNTDPGLNYAIPPTNPFVGNAMGIREEIWAWGFRNPYRCSFDAVTGRFWVADVGQNTIEEIDIVEGGRNYGWNTMEGSNCFNPPSGCNINGLTPPVWEYTHAIGISITGGYVYRGTLIPSLVGQYVYGDWGSGRIWALDYDGINPTVNTELFDTSFSITSFGRDRDGELFLCASNQSQIYRLIGCTPTGIPDIVPVVSQLKLEQNYPNPFNPTTVLSYSVPRHLAGAHVRLVIYNSRGAKVAVVVDGPKGEGPHEVIWDGTTSSGRRVASGVYFSELQVGPETTSRKMVLVQ